MARKLMTERETEAAEETPHEVYDAMPHEVYDAMPHEVYHAMPHEVYGETPRPTKRSAHPKCLLSTRAAASIGIRARSGPLNGSKLA
jgi:hypothetical protein